MANHYNESTVEPAVSLTPELQQLLHAYGADTDQNGDRFYIYFENGVNNDDQVLETLREMLDDAAYAGGDMSDDIDAEIERQVGEVKESLGTHGLAGVFRRVLLMPKNGNVEGIRLEGCNRCDKMRQGAFGGHALVVTREGYARLSTGAITVKNGGITIEMPTIHKFGR